MPTVKSGPTITPSFPEFLPPWVRRQPWYRGSGGPRLTMVGSFRLEDPAGEVGMETHLLRGGDTIYQVPMTYRGAPRPDAPPESLIVSAEHSVLGPRWIYDAEKDPVWRAELLRFIRAGESAAMGSWDGEVPAAVRGRPLAPLSAGLARPGPGATIEICRRLPLQSADPADPDLAGAAGLLTGTFRTGTGDSSGPETVTALLAVVRHPLRR